MILLAIAIVEDDLEVYESLDVFFVDLVVVDGPISVDFAIWLEKMDIFIV